MRHSYYLSLPILVALFIATNATAQNDLTKTWRIIKKVRTETNGQQYTFEYAYTNEGRIQTVKYLSATGTPTITIDNFNFGRNNKPTSYRVTYNRENATVDVTLQYDEAGRLIRLEKKDSPRETTTFNYRYSSGSYIIVQEKTGGQAGSIKDNRMAHYNESGDYVETNSEAASQRITTTVTQNKSPNTSLTPHPDNFFGGFSPPSFLGEYAYGTEPQATAIKDQNGLITSLTFTNRTSTRKNEYSYAKIGATITEPETNSTKIVIATNINCSNGKQIVERIISSQEGVKKAIVDIRTGKLALDYSTDGTPYVEIIKLINEAGFDADRSKSTNPEANPCKEAAPATKTLSIQTTINCEQGKQLVERSLSAMEGVSNISIDSRTGKITLDYTGARTPQLIIKKINEAGFDADRSKTTTPEANPCAVKPKSAAVTIQTTINCAAGKTKIETLLKEQDGVVAATVDIKTGKLLLDYSTDGTPYSEIIRLINETGFDADGKKSSNPGNNPCAAKKYLVSNFQTNSKCIEGRDKIESLLKKQKGVIGAYLDINTSKLKVEHTNEITDTQLRQLILDAGVDVDGKKTTSPDSNPCKEKIVKNEDKPFEVTPPKKVNEEVLKSKFTTIKGKLFYRYKKENEQPVNSDLGLQTTYKKIQVGPTYKLVEDKNSFPSIAAAQRWPKTNDNGTQPLKKTSVRIIYTLLTSKEEAPKRYEDFMFPIEKPKPGDDAGLFEKTMMNNYEIGRGETEADGSFSFTFYNQLSLGYLGSFEGFKEVITGANDGAWKPNTKYVSTGNFHMYGAIRIHVNDGEFYSPDILLFPKPGATLQLPDEVALVNSFDLSVIVKTDPSIYDQVIAQNAPLSGYPVKVGRLQENIAKEYGLFPFEAKEQEKKGMSGTTADGKVYKIFDENETGGDGSYEFKNLCYANEHLIQAPESKYDGSFVYKLQDKSIDGELGDPNRIRFNTSLKIKKIRTELLLTPKLPELYVRAIAKVKGDTKGLGGVAINLSKKWFGMYLEEAKTVTKDDGYWQVKDLPVRYVQEMDASKKMITRVKGPGRRLKFSKPGYADVYVPAKDKVDSLQLGQRWPKPTEVIMTGNASLMGHVQNEEGKSIVSEIKVADGPYIKTKRVLNHDGAFFIDNCEAGTKIKVIVLPAAGQYFSDTLFVDIPAGKTTNLGAIVLKERLHRVIFKIKDESNKPVAGAVINFNNSVDTYTTSKDGQTGKIEISSPGDEFHVVVNAVGFTRYDEYVIVPESKNVITIPLTLKKGKIVSGYVKDAVTKQPISNARVYTTNGYNEDGAIETETYTNKDGYYEIAGVPQSFKKLNPTTNKISNSRIIVYAVKSGTPAYLQQQQSAYDNETSNINFELEPFNCKAEIWGLPIEVTAVDKTTNGYKISGAFVKLPANATFKAANSNAKLPFKNIAVKIATQKDLIDTKLAGTNCTIEPLADFITTEASAVKIILFDKFNCELTGAKQNRGFENLVVTKTKGANCGVVKGLVQSKLESFNFSYQYDGSFLLQNLYKDKLKNIANTTEMIEVFGTGSCIAVADKYRLSVTAGKETFNLLDFKAKFISGSSYVVRDTFSLSIAVDLDVPLVKDKTLNAGTIKVMQNNFIWNEYKGNVNIPVETWTIKGSGLQYDKNQGGFRVLDAALQTNLPQLPLKSLIIKPYSLDLAQESIDAGKIISLAGVEPLYLNNAKPALVFDEVSPHDQKPHWRLNLFNGTNEPVAFLQNIPGLASTDKINITLFSNFSDGNKNLQIEKGFHSFFNVMQQEVTGIEMSSNSFTLIGVTDLQIPGSSSIIGRLKYLKENGNTVCIPEKLNTDVEAIGKVSFSGKQSLTDYVLRENYFSANGTATIYETNKNDKNNVIPLAAQIIKENGTTRLELVKQKEFPLGGITKQKMIITEGRAVVDSGKWTNLKFTTQLKGYDVINKPGEDMLDFEVKGAIVNDVDPSAKKLSIDNIETPLGGLAISFDFSNKIFFGALHINYPLVIPPGLFTVNEGLLKVQLDRNGFILTGSFPDVLFNPIAAIGKLKCGVALGYYNAGIPKAMADDLRMVTINKKTPEPLGQRLKGVYISLAKGFEYPLDVPLIGITAGIYAGIDISTIVNFNKGAIPDVVAELSGSVKGEVSVEILGCEHGFYLKSDVGSKIGYENGEFVLLLNTGVGAGIKGFCKELPAASVNIEVGIKNGSWTFTPSIL
jgi:copper chaperone CopZ